MNHGSPELMAILIYTNHDNITLQIVAGLSKYNTILKSLAKEIDERTVSVYAMISSRL